MSVDGSIGRAWAVVLATICPALACGPAQPRPAGVVADRSAGTAGSAAPAGAVVSTPPPPAPPAATAKPPAVAPEDGKVREITFDDLKLPLEKGEPYTPAILPPAVDALRGQTVRIRGYILPSFQQKGITQFVLVRDNMECCFGPGALLHDCIVVRMRPGKSAEFSIRPVAVAGSFRIEELKGPDGRHLAVYAIDGDAVE